MERRIIINANMAVISEKNIARFEEYDEVVINAGTVLAKESALIVLEKKKLTTNCGRKEILDADSELVIIKSSEELNKHGSYRNCSLIVLGDLFIRPEHSRLLEQIKDIYVTGDLICPSSIDKRIKSIGGTSYFYPETAQIEFGGYTLDQEKPGKMSENSVIWIKDRLTIMEEKPLEAALQKSVSFICGSLLIYESLYQQYEELFNCSWITKIPDGYVYQDAMILTKRNIAVYGTKFYIGGDLLIRQKDVSCLNNIEALVVKGTAKIPESALDLFKTVGTAADYLLYEGDFWQIDNDEMISHEQLNEAVSVGITYTIEVNGHLKFAPDVTKEDLDCILNIYYDGIIEAEDKLLPHLKRKVCHGDGFMGKIPVIEQQAADSEAVQVNTGIYV